ncbi:N-6 DNA methylase [bacterium]|nr:N-6 DNA methylase [bacterium]
MASTLEQAISEYGRLAKAKLAGSGEPEDQLRAPFEGLLSDLAELVNLPRQKVVAVGEARISDLKIRPDYAVNVHGALVGHVELKAPGKGADPRKFRDPHDKAQWHKLSSLPNLIYSDGNEFSLWRDGELVGSVVRLEGDIESSGAKLSAPGTLLGLFESFLQWAPSSPRNVRELAHTSARLCRLLREEVTEQLALKSEALTSLAKDWRMLLFPEANDQTFADGYSQAVTFGLLMARAKGITLAHGFQEIARELSATSTLIGAALRLLTDNAENQKALETSLGTLIRVLDVVDWSAITKGEPEAWLYFYEDFLSIYDNDLRKLTGSYYTPPEVVAAMVRLVDDILRSPRFGLPTGLASPVVSIADPATGTGTFLLGLLRRIADTVKEDEGEGAVAEAITQAAKRLVAFELQLGPFAVAQLRMLAEITALTGATPKAAPQMFVTNTLGNPQDDEGWIPGILAPIAKSRKEANRIKREQPITVVIGNPPYKEKAKGMGGWIEGQRESEEAASPLADWQPPREWKAGAHAKHLRNLYIYFWRWATWKVFDHGPGKKEGVVCFITVAGFLAGPGFQKMRDYLRRTANDIWVIDCSPEGHQPDVPTRIFQGVQQPVCIVIVARHPKKKTKTEEPATVRFTALPAGPREEKFAALAKVTLTGKQWVECPTDWRAPFLPASTGAWATYPKLEELFVYHGSGVQPGRTWVIAPDTDSLIWRWKKLVQAKPEEKEMLFQPHPSKEGLGDRHVQKIVSKGLPGFPDRPTRIANESSPSEEPIRYGFRSFDRQWIIPDNRVINRPNPGLWASRSVQQFYLTAVTRTSPTCGPGITFTASIPDYDHYKGSFGGRVMPLWSDAKATVSNVRPALLATLSARLAIAVQAPDVMAYIAGIAAHPAYTARFQEDLSTPGLRIPFTADAALFQRVAEAGRRVIWLHTFGERMADADAGRPAGPPRMPPGRRPTIPAKGTIPPDADALNWDGSKERLLVGGGYVDNVPAPVWQYEVSGKQVLVQWFSYRRKSRDRPIMGDRRPPSPLGNIQPEGWLAEYTTELLNVLNVLGLLVEMEPLQAELLEAVCNGPIITDEELKEAGAFVGVDTAKSTSNAPDLFDGG